MLQLDLSYYKIKYNWKYYSILLLIYNKNKILLNYYILDF
jgi:hypothetical protein